MLSASKEAISDALDHLRYWSSMALLGVLRGVIDDHALVSRGMTLTVAERARAPIIGLRYGLPWYFAR